LPSKITKWIVGAKCRIGQMINETNLFEQLKVRRVGQIIEKTNLFEQLTSNSQMVDGANLFEQLKVEHNATDWHIRSDGWRTQSRERSTLLTK